MPTRTKIDGSKQVQEFSISADRLDFTTIITREQPSEIPDGTSVVNFTILDTPIEGTVQVFLNGLLQNEGLTNDYTISGPVITFKDPPETDSIILVNYMK